MHTAIFWFHTATYTAALKCQNEGFEKAKALRKTYLLNKLNFDERAMYIIISENPNIVSTHLYKNYRKQVKSRKGPVAPRTFRKYLEELILKGIIKAIGAKKGRAKVLVAVI